MPDILLATDFSEGSAAAERTATELARKLGSTITVLHAYQPPAFAEPNMVFYAPTPEMTEDIRRSAHESLQVVAERLRQSGVPVQTLLVEGVAAANEIARVADEGAYDFVVLGTHGRTGLTHVILGSVAEKVVRTCRRPVLTVRAESAAAAERAHSPA